MTFKAPEARLRSGRISARQSLPIRNPAEFGKLGTGERFPMREFGPLERLALIGSVLCCVLGAGLLIDGKKQHQRELERSEKVDYQLTVNPF
jgi:hypothetical protein